jgi:deoxyribonuclease-4
MEMEFVRGVKMSEALAKQCGELAKKLDVRLSAHAPYYINLLSEEKEKIEASRERILQTCRVVSAAGRGKVVFHPGYYGKLIDDKKTAFKEMKNAFADLISRIGKEKLNATLAPETTGGWKEWGSFQELVEMCSELGTRDLWMTIDFSHLHARNGKPELNSKQDYARLFDFAEKNLGKKFVQDVHAHFQGIKWGQGGEIAHLPLSAGQPLFKPLAELIHEQGYGGTIISESPLLDGDALAMKRIFEKIK